MAYAAVEYGNALGRHVHAPTVYLAAVTRVIHITQLNGKVRAECEYTPRDGDCLIGASSPDSRERLGEPEVLRPLASLIPVRRYLILQQHSYNPGIGIAV